MKNDGNDKLRAWIEQAQFTVTSPAHAPHVNVPIQVVTVEGLLAALAGTTCVTYPCGTTASEGSPPNDCPIHGSDCIGGIRDLLKRMTEAANGGSAIPSPPRPPTQGELGPMNSKGHWGPCTNANHDDSQEGPCERHWIVDPDPVG